MLPQRFVAHGVQMDKGFFDEKNFNYLEDQCLQYASSGEKRLKENSLICSL
jgi:hypothetical protein